MIEWSGSAPERLDDGAAEQRSSGAELRTTMGKLQDEWEAVGDPTGAAAERPPARPAGPPEPETEERPAAAAVGQRKKRRKLPTTQAPAKPTRNAKSTAPKKRAGPAASSHAERPDDGQRSDHDDAAAAPKRSKPRGELFSVTVAAGKGKGKGKKATEIEQEEAGQRADDAGQRADDAANDGSDADSDDFVGEVDDKQAHAKRMLVLERSTPSLISKHSWPVDENLKLGAVFTCRVDCEAMAMAYAEENRMLLKRKKRTATVLRYGCKMCGEFSQCFVAKDMGGDDGAFTSRGVYNPLALFLLTFC